MSMSLCRSQLLLQACYIYHSMQSQQLPIVATCRLCSIKENLLVSREKLEYSKIIFCTVIFTESPVIFQSFTQQHEAKNM